ncbi:hypothetical protein BH10PSE12_BH10PSE12_09250 [soil metagenome]
MAISPELRMIAQDAQWLPHRYDPVHDAVHFLKVDRQAHRAATFLVDGELPADAAKLVLRFDDSAQAAAPTAAPLHYIFHSAYCCSTLLARAFDYPGMSMALKEPVILTDIVGARRRGLEAAKVSRALDGVLNLLAQPFGPGEAVIVKPSNIITGIAAPMLALRPASRALLLHAPLRVYLTSIAKKGMWGRMWVREYFVAALKDGIVDLGFDPEQLMLQTDLQIAATGWLAQHKLFAQIASRFGPDRVQTLNSETLIARPLEAMTALIDLFGLAMTPDQIAALVAGPAFSRHSKFDKAFSGQDRKSEERDAANLHADEIEKVVIWAEAVAKSQGVAMTLGSPLVA